MQLASHVRISGIIAALITSAPILMGVTKRGTSSILTALILLGLVLGWKAIRELDFYDRMLAFGFALLLLVVSIEMLFWPEAPNAKYILKQFLRIGLAFGLLILFRRYGVCAAKHLWRGVLLAAPVFLAVAIYQISQGKARAEGVVGAVQFGEFAALVAALACVGFFGRVFGSTFKPGWLAAFVAASIAVLLSETRAALVFEVIAVSGTAFYFYISKRAHASDLKLFVATIIVGLAITGLFFSNAFNFNRFQGFQHEVATLENGTESRGGLKLRLKMWNEAMVLWKESPWTGKGLGNYGIEARSRRLSGEFETLGWGRKRDYELTTPHSNYFEILADAGVIGLLTFTVSLIAIPVWVFLGRLRQARDNSQASAAFSGLLVITGFTIFGLTESWYIYSMPVAVYLLFVTGLATSNQCKQT